MSQGLALTALSVLSLFAGVVLPRWLNGGPWPGFWQGLILGAVGGLVALVVVPEALEHAGPPALLATLLGAAVPSVLERAGAARTGLGDHLTLGAALLALLLHTALDGLGLAAANRPGASGAALAAAIVAHRFPVGLALWLVAVPRYGPRGAALVLVLVGATTFIGYFLGDALLPEATSVGLQLFQAFVAGSLFHVLLHTPEVPRRGPLRWSELIGAALGLGFVFVLPDAHAEASIEAGAALRRLLALARAAAPALLAGWVIAAVAPTVLARAGARSKIPALLLTELPVSLLTLALLGPRLALLRAIAASLVRRLWAGESPPASAKAAFTQAIDRGAPWIIFGLGLAANLEPETWRRWIGESPSYLQGLLLAPVAVVIHPSVLGLIPIAAALTATPTWGSDPALVLVALLLLWSIARQGPRAQLTAILRPDLAHRH